MELCKTTSLIVVLHLSVWGILIGAEDPQPERCFDELGCLSTPADWFHLVHRPLNLSPEQRSVINTKFYVFDDNAPVSMIAIDPHNLTWLSSRGFAEAKTVKFVVHGYLDNGFSAWIARLASALQPSNDTKVIITDWSRGSLTGYNQAVANARLVALELSYLATELVSQGIVPSKDVFHCIGHSLGSHICGYVGKTAGPLGRISALDPAGPLFQYLPCSVRLCKEDSNFTEVFHTDGGSLLSPGFGMVEPCGHMDYYPNGGHSQPGCDKTPSFLVTDLMNMEYLQRRMLACSHHKAIDYYINTLREGCAYMACPCNDFLEYREGKCIDCSNGTCHRVGQASYQIQVTPEKYYFTTGEDDAACDGTTLLVKVVTAWPKQAQDSVFGKLRIFIQPAQGRPIEIDSAENQKSKTIEHGSSLSYMLHMPKTTDPIASIKISWENDKSSWTSKLCFSSFLCPQPSLYIKDIELYALNESSCSGRSSSNVKLCGTLGTVYTTIEDAHSIKFSRQC